jgi:hypothetical protein
VEGDLLVDGVTDVAHVQSLEKKFYVVTMNCDIWIVTLLLLWFSLDRHVQ